MRVVVVFFFSFSFFEISNRPIREEEVLISGNFKTGCASSVDMSRLKCIVKSLLALQKQRGTFVSNLDKIERRKRN